MCKRSKTDIYLVQINEPTRFICKHLNRIWDTRLLLWIYLSHPCGKHPIESVLRRDTKIGRWHSARFFSCKFSYNLGLPTDAEGSISHTWLCAGETQVWLRKAFSVVLSYSLNFKMPSSFCSTHTNLRSRQTSSSSSAVSKWGSQPGLSGWLWNRKQFCFHSDPGNVFSIGGWQDGWVRFLCWHLSDLAGVQSWLDMTVVINKVIAVWSVSYFKFLRVLKVPF